MTLRARLVAGLLVLAALGMTALGIGTYTALRSFLYDKVDDQLRTGRFPAARVLTDGILPGPAPDRSEATANNHQLERFNNNRVFVEVRDDSGDTVFRLPSGPLDKPDPLPDLPPTATLISRSNHPFTVGAKNSALDYRVLVTTVAGAGGTVITALPLREVRDTLDRLVLIELVAAVLVLAALAGSGWWLVRRGLRPLESMAASADSIAGGDLAGRVEPAEPRTEVGRLGLALNSMLGQIELAFTERSEAENRLRQFVADASHELRTPLTAIRGYADLYDQGAIVTEDGLADAMRRIEQESRRMGVLVDDLLLLARLDQGRPLERETVDLAPLVTDCVLDARAAQPDRAISLHLPDEPATISGDAHRLHQVVANLLANACVHTPAGTDVRVRVNRDARDVSIEVSDDGPGIDPAVASRVFERFYRADPSRARGHGGSGLGLSIVAAIVEAHGGTVTLAAPPQAGATFTVKLPATAGSLTANSTEAHSLLQARSG